MASKPSYRPVPQKDEDEEEEEELTIYDRKFGQGAYEENVELIFRQSKSRPLRRANNKKAFLSYNNNRILGCFAVILVALLVAIIIGYALWMVSENTISSTPSLSPPSPTANQSTTGVPTSTPTAGSTPVISSTDLTTWRVELSKGLTESSVHLSDINSDGIPDVLTTFVTGRYQNPTYDHCHGDDQHDKCREEFGFSPCQTRLLALNGKSGEILWDTWVEYGPFAINCRVDLNLDSHLDCIFAGRTAGFSAYDIFNHRLLWIVDPSITCVAYNYYFPLVTKDFNRDGIHDIIAIHGGDPRYADSDKNRTPGFLVVVSGATGEQLSERILTPDNHESYSSPVLYTTHDNIELVLFGSGGETISGSLWAVTLNSLSENIKRYLKNKDGSYSENTEYKFRSCYTKLELSISRPKINHSIYSTSRHDDWMNDCPILPGNNQPIWNKYELCMYEFIPAGSVGTMLPPVITDVNKDGSMDLLVSQFNEHTLLYDGATGGIIWDHFERDTQTYSVPTALHFNDDDTLDILVRFNKGRWMDYDYSYLAVLDGNSGNILWNFNCTRPSMSSPLVLQSEGKGQDAMIFLGAGCKREPIEEDQEEGEDENRGHHQQKGGGGGRKKKRAKRLSLICPRRHFDFENSSKSKRMKYHHDIAPRDSDGFLPMDGGSGGGEQTGHTPPPPSGSIDDILSKYIPDDLWIARNASDSFPDPWGDQMESFIQDYCNMGPADSWEVSLYFVTSQLVSQGGPIPIDSFRPYVHKPSAVSSGSNNRQRRHGGGGGHDHNPIGENSEFETIKSLLQDRKGLRCAHIMTPLNTAGTPAITDLNGDGKYEIVTTVVYSPIPSDYTRPVLNFIHMPKIIVQTFTIDTRLKEIGVTNVDSSSYYPLNEQPWTQYMGREGNGIYNTH